MTTIQLLDVSDPPAPPPPLNARVAIMVIAILVVGGGILAALAGPETVLDPADTEPRLVEPNPPEGQLP